MSYVIAQSELLELSLVVPVFNEEATVLLFIDHINTLFKQHLDIQIEYIFVNDGSTDTTLTLLLNAQKHHSHIKIIDLSRNFGKEAALTAGLLAATGQVIVPIDVDLQDPPALIFDMIAKWKEGFEVVLAHRVSREKDSMAKKTSASLFYKLHNKIAWPAIPENVGDFRLMDRCVIEALKELPESRRFMKGIFAWLGFHTAYLDYNRSARIAGTTKFNAWRLWNFALEGITSFSTSPLKISTYIGLGVSLASFIYALIIVMKVVINGIDVPGYASIMVTVTFLGGLQLMGIGILGEYLGRTYIESKRRPTYIVRRIYSVEEKS